MASIASAFITAVFKFVVFGICAGLGLFLGAKVSNAVRRKKQADMTQEDNK